jgi:branched-chain amino acid transport system ATP-binding protein
MSSESVALQAENISVSYGPVHVLKHVSLRLMVGECVSLIGPNGAGKTTLMGALSGGVPVTGGRVLLNGQDVTAWRADKRARAGIGRSFQTTHLFPTLTTLENVYLAVQAREGTNAWDYLRRVRKRLLDEAESRLEQVQLTAHRDKPSGTLSHGDKRKLEVAMLLALKPNVLLLDEPTAGMAVSEVPGMLQLIDALKAQRAYAMVLVEHKMDVVMQLSDRIVVLHQGQVLAEGEPDEMMHNADVAQAYLGVRHETRA